MMYILLSSIALQYLHKVFRNHAYLVYIPIDPVVSLGRITITILSHKVDQALIENKDYNKILRMYYLSYRKFYLILKSSRITILLVYLY